MTNALAYFATPSVKSLKRFSAVDNSLSDAMLENGISQLMQFRQAAAAHAANAQATTL
jgi:hypothetical protein